MALVGLLQLLAAWGVGAGLMHARPVTVAFTHVVLLAWITPMLAAALSTGADPVGDASRAARLRPGSLVGRGVPAGATVAAGVMALAVAAFGWPWLLQQGARLGLTPMATAWVAAFAGALSAALWLTVLPLLPGAAAPKVSHDVPPRAADDSRAADPGRALPPLRARPHGAAAGRPRLAAAD
jgi:hypothetical protein